MPHDRRTFIQLAGMATTTVAVGGLGSWAGGSAASAAGGAATDWLKAARWGFFNQGQMAEYQAPQALTVSSWNAAVNAFDVDGVANQLQLLGAGYLIHCLGQNSGFYSSPNATYDGYVGRSPSRCSTRDLVADLAAALGPRGIALMVYLPAGAPAVDAQAVSALEWTDGPGNRNANFQVKWQNVIQEWCDRWGSTVAGWWFDGCYWPNDMYNFAATPNWNTFAAAVRHGNANSLIAFNPGIQNPIQAMTPQQDYAAGEIADPLAVFCDGRFLTAPANNTASANTQVQFQMLTYMGPSWGLAGASRFTDPQIVSASNAVVDGGGVVTWDTPVLNPSGLIDAAYAARLSGMSNQLLGRYLVNDTDTGITYAGGTWNYSSGRNVPDLNADVHYTNTNGAYAQFTFNGTGIQYLTERDSDMGNVEIYIDGTLRATVNCFTTGGKRTQQVTYATTGLSAGSHTIKVVKKDGVNAIVDGFNVLTTTATVVNDNAAGITYTGSWAASTGRNVTDVGRDVHYTATDNDWCQYTFIGAGIQYLREMDTDMGNVDVHIDGDLQGTYSCYRTGGKLTQQPVFTKLGLAPGSHTIRVTKKSGSYALLDALRVFT